MIWIFFLSCWNFLVYDYRLFDIWYFVLSDGIFSLNGVIFFGLVFIFSCLVVVILCVIIDIFCLSVVIFYVLMVIIWLSVFIFFVFNVIFFLSVVIFCVVNNIFCLFGVMFCVVSVIFCLSVGIFCVMIVIFFWNDVFVWRLFWFIVGWVLLCLIVSCWSCFVYYNILGDEYYFLFEFCYILSKFNV